VIDSRRKKIRKKMQGEETELLAAATKRDQSNKSFLMRRYTIEKKANKRLGPNMLSRDKRVIPRTRRESKSHIPMATRENIHPHLQSFRRPMEPIYRKRDINMSGRKKASYTLELTGMVS